MFGKLERITFLSKEIPSILGFEGVPDGNGIHIAYKMNTIADKLMKSDETKAYYGELPADLLAGKHLIFVYANIIEYQYVGDAKAPLLRVIDSKQRLKDVSVCEVEPTHRIVFLNLDYKKLLTNTIQSISNELRTETGDLVPFWGSGKVLLTLQFKGFQVKMDSYYANQATSLPHFSGHYRQRSSGFGALAAGFGRVAPPLARRFILPTANRIGKELLKQSVPELLDVVSSKKSPMQALKNTISKTAKNADWWITEKNITTTWTKRSVNELIQKVESSNQTEKHHFHSEAPEKKSVRFFR